MKLLILALLLCCSNNADPDPVEPDAGGGKAGTEILVFTKTKGYRHASIGKGVATLRALGEAHDFRVARTEDSSQFTTENLEKYQLVIFLSTTMDVLNAGQQEAFEAYILGGGAFLGIHAAADTEYDWPWYGDLVGAWFKSHPEQQQARMEVVKTDHPSTAHLGTEWFHYDEWYNYKEIRPGIQVLLRLDETSYEGGENGEDHPIAWYREFDGGRTFYTGLGHTEAAFDDPKFRQHLLGGIQWCLGRN